MLVELELAECRLPSRRSVGCVGWVGSSSWGSGGDPSSDRRSRSVGGAEPDAESIVGNRTRRESIVGNRTRRESIVGYRTRRECIVELLRGDSRLVKRSASATVRQHERCDPAKIVHRHVRSRLPSRERSGRTTQHEIRAEPFASNVKRYCTGHGQHRIIKGSRHEVGQPVA